MGQVVDLERAAEEVRGMVNPTHEVISLPFLAGTKAPRLEIRSPERVLHGNFKVDK
jgi:hypothetical protein